MEEFEEKLNSILSSPDAMRQIMSLADSIAGGTATPSGDNVPAPVQSDTNPLSLLQSIDPAMLQTISRLFREYSSAGDEKTALLGAIRPFLKPERQGKLDKALQITRISRVIRTAFDLYRGDSHV